MRKKAHKIIFKIEAYLLFVLTIIDLSYLYSILTGSDVVSPSTFEFEITSYPLIIALLLITSLFFVHYTFGLLANFIFLLAFFVFAIAGYYYDNQKQYWWLHVGLFIVSVIYFFVIIEGIKNVTAAISV